MRGLRAPLLAEADQGLHADTLDAGTAPTSWRKTLVQLLMGELAEVGLQEQSRQAIPGILPETVCVLALPPKRRPSDPPPDGDTAGAAAHGSSAAAAAGSGGPVPDAAALLQQKLLVEGGAAVRPRYVPPCHRAVQLVQLASACAAAHRRLPAARAGHGKGGARATSDSDPLAYCRQDLLAFQSAVMSLAQAELQQQPGGAVWSGPATASPAAAVDAWVAAARPAPSELVPAAAPRWAPPGLLCLPNGAVTLSSCTPSAALASLRAALDGRHSGQQLLPRLHTLREALHLPPLPLRWSLPAGSLWQLRPARTVLHVLWQEGAVGGTRSASRTVRTLPSLLVSSRTCKATLLLHVLTRPGVADWLRQTPVQDMPAAPKWGVVDYRDSAEGPASTPDSLSPDDRLLIMECGQALLMVDVHWELVPPRPRRSVRGMCTIQ